MKWTLIIFLCCLGMNTTAQTIMNIHQSGEPVLEIPIADVDSITYSVVGDPGSFALVTTLPMMSFTATTAMLGGTVDLNGGTAITDRGIAWSALPSPTTGDSVFHEGSGSGTFSAELTGLLSGTLYYARAYAINSAGAAYGNELSFTVTGDVYMPSDSVTDIDGNVYATIHVTNGQTWMAENLKTCRYANGDSILNLTSDVDWAGTTEGSWVTYNNNPQHMDTFGKLYNGWSVEDPRNVCPVDWHVPTEAEWIAFHSVNGGQSYGGGNLKSTGISLWLSPNTGATNSSGFTAFPGGRRLAGGGFVEMFGSAFFWTSTGSSSSLNSRTLYYSSIGVWDGSSGKLEGLSVRCVKD